MTTTPRLWKSQTQVNTADAPVAPGGEPFQGDGQVAPLHDGGYVVVWTDLSETYHPNGAGIVGQRYDSTGNKVGGEVHLGYTGTADQFAPAVATLANGNIAVAFVDQFGSQDIWVRIFSPALTLLRNDPIDTGPTQTVDPSLTALADGGYVVSYTEGFGSGNADIVTRIVSATGAIGTEQSIDNGNDNQKVSELTRLSNGNFVVVYEDEFNGSASDHDIKYGIFTKTNFPVTAGQSVPGAAGSGLETDPDVAALRDGGFVIVWTDPDSSVTDIRASILSNAGATVASNIVVNTSTAGAQNEASVTALADGGFLVTWEDDNSNFMRAQRFDPLGAKIGGEFIIQDGVFGLNSPEAALLTDGRIAYAVGDVSTGDADVTTSIFTTRLADTHVHDFNDDGNGDILWHNDNGAVGIWELNGDTVIATASLGTTSPDWHIADNGDFNGDAKSDILWQNDNGATSIWELNGGSVIAAASLGTASPDWHIALTGDFNADNNSDILWRNDNGAVGLWQLKGGQVIAAASLGTASPDWHIAETGDFDGDGNSDILWRNDNGAVGIWELKVGQVVAATSLGNASPDWHIAGTGDFNADGNSDILWHNDNGAVSIWELNGGQVIATASLGTVGPDWHIAHTGDVNGDGKSDILWRNDNGAASIWEFNGGQVIATAPLGTMGNDWHIVA